MLTGGEANSVATTKDQERDRMMAVLSPEGYGKKFG
jgi:hypothetical protein